jgi:fatty acid desaturase
MHAPTSPLHVSADTVASFGRALDAIRRRELATLGAEDARYIRRVVRAQRLIAITGRGLIYVGIGFPPAWFAGVLALALSKILENMEIGHNVIHGQYDFMQDPNLSSRRYEWDLACPSAHWRHTHNYVHHTYTNVLGKDRDVGYGLLRISDDQPWEPRNRFNVMNATLLAIFFEWGIAVHHLEIDRGLYDRSYYATIKEASAVVWAKAKRQLLKDYVLFPLFAGPFFFSVFGANALANLIRNLWTFAVIFCGHFPAEVPTFREEDLENETHDGWYVRQLMGSANISGGPLFHLLTGNLSHQIEHHLFPDLPAHRYARIAVEVRALCEAHGLPYHTGSFGRQLASMAGRIVRMAKKPDEAVGEALAV